VSADGRQIAYVQTGLKIYSLPGGTTRDIDVVRPNPEGSSRAFSPNGRFLAINRPTLARHNSWS